jgi:hypothetical protein
VNGYNQRRDILAEILVGISYASKRGASLIIAHL